MIGDLAIRHGLENWLQTVRLGTDAVDCCDLSAIRQHVDVVADICVRWRKDHTAFAFDRQKRLLQVQRDRAIRICSPSIQKFGTHLDCAGLISAYAFSAPTIAPPLRSCS